MLTALYNLPAFLLPLVLFAYWFVVGYGVLSILNTRRHTIQNMMFAPTIGLVVSIVGVFNLSWLGLPVKVFAWPLCLSLFIVSLGILYFKKAIFPRRQYLPFFVIILIALYITARPLLEFGFSWLSYINSDMLFYCKGAERFIHYGFSDAPTAKMLTNGRDYSLPFWFVYVPGMERSGSELLLAWVSKLICLSPDRVYMPLILGLNFVLIHAIIGLNYINKKYRFLALLSAFLYSCAALANLGVFYQLIAQVNGLALLVVCTSFLLIKTIPYFKHSLLKYSILASLLLSAFALFYPELISFFVLSVLLYYAILLIKKEFPAKQFALLLGGIIVGLIIFLRSYIANALLFAFVQIGHANLIFDVSKILFPYFLIPSGLANLWGMQPIANLSPEPVLSISILSGLILLVCVTVFAVIQLWNKQNRIAASFLAMLLLMAHFFIDSGDFILFKLAMYIQPFLWSLFSAMIISWFSHRGIQLAACFILAGINLYSTQTYLNRSRGTQYPDIPYASQTSVGNILEKQLALLNSSDVVLSDTPRKVMEDLEALHGKGHILIFSSPRILEVGDTNVLNDNTFPHKYFKLYFSTFYPQVVDAFSNLSYAIKHVYKKNYFNLLLDNENTDEQFNFFKETKLPISKSPNFLLKSSPEQLVFNRWKRFSYNAHCPVKIVPLKNAQNHLMFINSQLGEDYYLAFDRSKISFYQLEPDYFYPHHTFVALGRYFLFKVVNPSSQTRVILNITSTLNGNSQNQLPKAIVIGKQRLPFPIVGYGSARVFSPPIESQQIKDESYIMVDLQKDGRSFPSSAATGMMKLYGQKVRLDYRKITVFGRDISLISNKQYQEIKGPTFIKKFPQDLDNPNLEYSGFYEDGWIGSNVYLYLTPLSGQKTLKLTGYIPGIPNPSFSPTLIIDVDNKKIFERHLTIGNFNIEIPISKLQGRQKIELHFSDMIILPNGDKRPVSAKIDEIGFIN